MARKSLVFILGGVAVGMLAILSACQGSAPTPIVIRETVEVQVTPAAPAADIPFYDQWSGSAHADKSAEAFNHWNTDDPAQIPTTCAKCHSTPGFQDFLGADGTAAGTVDNPAKIGTVITCVACHNSATANLTSVTMPSGIVLTDQGSSAVCMQCHQGRESTVSVNDAIKNAGVGPDEVSGDLGFINIHYFAAAATKFGGQAEGGYQYAGHSYDINFSHVATPNTCDTCHNMHSLQVNLATCQTCHTSVKTVDDLKNIRMKGSEEDYDGDGNITEGIYYEIQGLQEKLYAAIQAYGSDIAGTPIAYSADSYPYFFIDTNKNGKVDSDEAQASNGYKSWTPRLVEATYNYQFTIKDPGAFAHNAKYDIQLLTDSIDDLNSVLPTPIDMKGTVRNDAGHFDGSAETFRHWDSEGEVPGTCSRCHSAQGLPLYLTQGVSINQPVSNGLACSTCHDSIPAFTRYAPKTVTFPSGASLGFDNTDANLCLACHQGRASTVSVNSAITQSGASDDQVSDKLSFINAHYFTAGATIFGSEAQGAYQYAGKKYDGQFQMTSSFNTCLDCHDVHTQAVKIDTCSGCHNGATDLASLQKIRSDADFGIDFNGNGDSQEGIGQEINGMHDDLLAAIQKYATDRLKAPIAYSPDSYPYFFNDTNSNGKVDPDEAQASNAYSSWTPRLVRAAYNYQWVQKDPGAFAHNGHYIMQVLYDSIQNIGGSVAGMTRPQ